MGVSENGGTPKSSILIGFSIINIYKPSILGVFPLFLETPIYTNQLKSIFWIPFQDHPESSSAGRRPSQEDHLPGISDHRVHAVSASSDTRAKRVAQTHGTNGGFKPSKYGL